MALLLSFLLTLNVNAPAATLPPCGGPLSVNGPKSEVAPATTSDEAALALQNVIKQLLRLTARARATTSEPPRRFLVHLDHATMANGGHHLLPSLERLRGVRDRLRAGEISRVVYARGPEQVAALIDALRVVNAFHDGGAELRTNALTGAGLLALSSLLKAAAPDPSLAATLPAIYAATFGLCFLYRPVAACFARHRSPAAENLANAVRFNKIVRGDLDRATGSRTFAHLVVDADGTGERAVDHVYRRDPNDGTPELLVFARP